MPKRAMNPTEAGTERYKPGDGQRQNAADQGEGQVEEDEQGQPQGVEGQEEQEQDQPDGGRQDDRQPAHGPLLVLELAAPGQVIAGRERDVAADLAPGLGHESAQVPAGDVALDADPALARTRG